MSKKNYDFSGWATRNNIKCSDGRVIKKDAFVDNDGGTVPLVWNHNHTDADNVLGHALLENRDEGVYAYCNFNNTPQGENAKELVAHGDITALSIYANQLKQIDCDVVHGTIRELSLVLAGANPGAFIETVIAHSDSLDEEAIIFNCEKIEDIQIEHSEEGENIMEEKNKMNVEGTKNVNVSDVEHADKEETVSEIFDTLNEKQKAVVYALIAQALEDGGQNKTETEDTKMKHNAFENENVKNEEVISHSDMEQIFVDAKRIGNLGDAVKEYALAHSITNIDNFFPEPVMVGQVPEMIENETEWVKKVMSGVKHTPFARVKSVAANTTAAEARAKGYVKGAQKVEEVLTALKRTTTPATIYKLQKFDRDDMIDLNKSFDVVAWVKNEMRGKLDEEAARAILIGDGRSSDSDDKINELNIRPIYTDSDTYAVKKALVRADGQDDITFAKDFIRQVKKSRKDYKGSGTPTLFCSEDLFTNMLLIEDTNGRVIYDTEEKLRTALRVKEIVPVEPMENLVRTSEGYDYKLMGIIVNLADYNVGTDRGGEVNFFDDFVIDYNKYEYLIETRFSGALVKPFSALVFEEKAVHSEEAGQ